MPDTTNTIQETGELADLPDVLQLMQLAWAVVHGPERISKRMTGAIGVTGAQRLTLRRWSVPGHLGGRSGDGVARAFEHAHRSAPAPGCPATTDSRGRSSGRRRAVLRLTKRGERVNAAHQFTIEAAVALALDGIATGIAWRRTVSSSGSLHIWSLRPRQDRRGAHGPRSRIAKGRSDT